MPDAGSQTVEVQVNSECSALQRERSCQAGIRNLPHLPAVDGEEACCCLVAVPPPATALSSAHPVSISLSSRLIIPALFCFEVSTSVLFLKLPVWGGRRPKAFGVTPTTSDFLGNMDSLRGSTHASNLRLDPAASFNMGPFPQHCTRQPAHVKTID